MYMTAGFGVRKETVGDGWGTVSLVFFFFPFFFFFFVISAFSDYPLEWYVIFHVKMWFSFPNETSPLSETESPNDLAQCFRLASESRGCEHPLPTPLTQEVCCCTVGKAWGRNCERCPQVGTGEWTETKRSSYRLRKKKWTFCCRNDICLSACEHIKNFNKHSTAPGMSTLHCINVCVTVDLFFLLLLLSNVLKFILISCMCGFISF